MLKSCITPPRGRACCITTCGYSRVAILTLHLKPQAQNTIRERKKEIFRIQCKFFDAL